MKSKKILKANNLEWHIKENLMSFRFVDKICNLWSHWKPGFIKKKKKKSIFLMKVPSRCRSVKGQHYGLHNWILSKEKHFPETFKKINHIWMTFSSLGSEYNWNKKKEQNKNCKSIQNSKYCL